MDGHIFQIINLGKEKGETGRKGRRKGDESGTRRCGEGMRRNRLGE